MAPSIHQVFVSNYRGIHELELNFPRHAAVHGNYQVGKTSLFEALVLALDYTEDLPKAGKHTVFQGMIDFDQFHQSDSFGTRVVLSGFPTNDPADYPKWFANPKNIAWWDLETDNWTFEKPDKKDIGTRYQLASLVYYQAKIKGKTVTEKRYLGTKESTLNEDKGEPKLEKGFFDDLGVFYFPFVAGDMGKWTRLHYNEAAALMEGWRRNAMGYLRKFEKKFNSFVDFMDYVEAKTKGKKLSEDESQKMAKEIMEFVYDQTESLNESDKELLISKEQSSDEEVLDSLEKVYETADYRLMFQMIESGAYNFSGESLLHNRIAKAISRIEEGKPCIFLFDEPEVFFPRGNFWCRFFDLLAELPAVSQYVFATHNEEIFQHSEEESRLYLHNTFGALSALDEVLFKGLYQ